MMGKRFLPLPFIFANDNYTLRLSCLIGTSNKFIDKIYDQGNYWIGSFLFGDRMLK